MSTPKRGKAGPSESTEKSPRNFRWTQMYEDTLLDLLVRETRQGNRSDSSFMATAFRNVCKDFNRVHGTTITKKHIQSRIKTMESHFVMFHAAVNGLSGFSWNEDTKMFEAEETLWQQRIQENPQFAKFRDKACHNWDKLFELYGDTRARGEATLGLKEKSKLLNRGLDFDSVKINTDKFKSTFFESNESSSYRDYDVSRADATPTSTPDCGNTQQSGGTSRPKQKRKSDLITVMEDGYKTMADSINRLSMALVGTGEKVAGSKFDVSQNSQILEALSDLELDDDYKVRCYVFLSANPSKAALVVAAPTSLRGHLLKDIMTAAG